MSNEEGARHARFTVVEKGSAPVGSSRPRRGPGGTVLSRIRTILGTILVVVFILSLITLALQKVVSPDFDARGTKARQDVETIADAVKAWLDKNGTLPDSLESLTRKDARGKSWLDRGPKDPWDNDYLLIPGARRTEFMVVSMGPDQQRDTADDIRYPKDANR